METEAAGFVSKIVDSIITAGPTTALALLWAWFEKKRADSTQDRLNALVDKREAGYDVMAKAVADFATVLKSNKT